MRDGADLKSFMKISAALVRLDVLIKHTEDGAKPMISSYRYSRLLFTSRIPLFCNKTLKMVTI